MHLVKLNNENIDTDDNSETIDIINASDLASYISNNISDYDPMGVSVTYRRNGVEQTAIISFTKTTNAYVNDSNGLKPDDIIYKVNGKDISFVKDQLFSSMIAENSRDASVTLTVKRDGKLNPKAIVAVDFLGNPANYEELNEIAKVYNLLLIEDAAQSIGASYRGNMCGMLGDIATTSFFPSKPLGCYGDGGAVLTNDDEIAKKIKSLRIHGKGKDKYDNIYVGINSRLDTMQAEILDIKIKYLREEINIRQKIAERYNEALKTYVKVPYVDRNSISAYAQYVILLEDCEQRNKLKEYLATKNIPSIIYYPNPLHLLPVFKGVNVYNEELKNSEEYGNTNLGIPFSPYLGEEEQNFIIKEIINYFEGEV